MSGDHKYKKNLVERDGTHSPKMIEVEILHREYKEPKQLIQGGIEGGENTPLRG